MQVGTIKKLVRTAKSSPSGKSSVAQAPGEGYGIIAAETGEHVFFVDSAVTGGRFLELANGQRVFFVLEDGPLTRAKSVQPARNGEEENAAPTSEACC